ncbi:hypothetical protein B6I21_01120 [candidate division KSB1 bacterium 4572_119]|nr:MAG: hypothetical protein B6I21_01120 [candidate division KSB1 bacterium 4572_119]
MEKFLKFKDEINLRELQDTISDPRIVVLRKSQTTDTIQVRVPSGMSNKEIKKVFGPFEVKKVYSEFPYPIQGDGLGKFLIWPIAKLIQRDA